MIGGTPYGLEESRQNPIHRHRRRRHRRHVGGLAAFQEASGHGLEKDGRIGGHANTVDVNGIGVDTGFIVYNEELSQPDRAI